MQLEDDKDKIINQLLTENNDLRDQIYQLAKISQDAPTTTDLDLLKNHNLQLKDLLQQIQIELEEFNAPEKSPKEQAIEQLKHLLEIQPDDEENIKTFIAALEDGLLDNHEGRIAVLHEGGIFGATFESDDAFRSFKPRDDNNSYTLITVPGGQQPVITSYGSHQIEVPNFPRSDHFDPIMVPLTFIHHGNDIGTFQYEVDTGASNTSCPCIYQYQSTEIIERKSLYSKVRYHYKTLAFWELTILLVIRRLISH